MLENVCVATVGRTDSETCTCFLLGIYRLGFMSVQVYFWFEITVYDVVIYIVWLELNKGDNEVKICWNLSTKF